MAIYIASILYVDNSCWESYPARHLVLELLGTCLA